MFIAVVLEADVRNQLYHNSNTVSYALCYHSYSAVIYSHSMAIDGNISLVVVTLCVCVCCGV
jgi:hypothetical protein